MQIEEVDVLFLIVQHLRSRQLFGSAVTLLRESDIDTCWLAGPSKEMHLLREWIFTGELDRVRAFIAPLQRALPTDDFTNMTLLLDKHERMERFFTCETSKKERQQLLEELRTGKWPLERQEVAQCIELLVSADDGWTEKNKGTRCSTWNREEARWKFYERLVAFFRDDITPEDDEYKYLKMPPQQLVYLIADAMQYHKTKAEDGSPHESQMDCISLQCNTAGQKNILKISTNSCLHIVTSEKRDAETHSDRVTTTKLTKSMDWSAQLKPCEWKTNNPGESAARLTQHRRDPYVQSIDFGASSGMRRYLPLRSEPMRAYDDIVTEEEEEAIERLEIEIREAAVVDNPPSHHEQRPVYCDCATQTDITKEHVPDTSALSKDIQEEEYVDSNNADVNAQNVNESMKSITSSMWTHSTTKNDNSVIIGTSESQHSELVSPPSVRYGGEKTVSSPPDNRMDTPSLLYSSIAFENSSSEEPPNNDESGEDNDEHEDQTQSEMEDDNRNGHKQLRYGHLTVDNIVKAHVIAEVKEAHAVRAMDIRRDGMQVVIGTNARAVRVFDLSKSLGTSMSTSLSTSLTSSTHNFLPLLPVVMEKHKHHQSAVYCVAFNDCKSSVMENVLVASGAADNSIKILSMKTNQELWIRNHNGKTRALQFASQDLLWSASSADMLIRCWDINHSLTAPYLHLDGHVGEIQAIALPDADRMDFTSKSLLLSAALDNTIRLWDARSGQCERIVAKTPHSVFTLAFNPADNMYFATGSQDGSVSLWDLRGKKRAVDTMTHHQDECRAVSWSPDGNWLLSSSFDGTLCIIEYTARKDLQAIASFRQHHDKVLQAQWHPVTPAIVTTGADKLVKLWTFA